MPSRSCCTISCVSLCWALGAASAPAGVVIGEGAPTQVAIVGEAPLYSARLGGATLYRFRDDLDVSGDPLALFAGAATPLFSTASPFDSDRAAEDATTSAPRSASQILPLVRETGFDRALGTDKFFSLLDADGLQQRLASFDAAPTGAAHDWRSMATASLPSPIGYVTDPSVAGQLGVALLAGQQAGAHLFPSLGSSAARLRTVVADEAPAPRAIPAASLVPEPSSLWAWSLVAASAALWAWRRRALG